MRPSDADTFLLPKQERELVYAQMLFDRLGATADLASIDDDWPDVEAIFPLTGRRIGIELTQPELPDQSSGMHRRYEQIIAAAFRQFEKRDDWDSAITVEFADTLSTSSFGHNFDPTAFVMEIVSLVRDCAQLLKEEAGNFEILFENSSASETDQVATVYEGGCWKFCLSDTNRVQRPLASSIRAIYVNADRSDLATPYIFIENDRKSRDQSAHAENWRQIEEAVRRKTAIFVKRGRSDHFFEEMWLVIHHPVYGLPSFGAGRLDGRELDTDIAKACGFDRVFLLGLGEAFELDFNNLMFKKTGS